MDYVLSITDNLFFDYLYAKALPLPAEVLSSLGNATITAARPLGPNDPVSEFLGFKPSEYAIMSQWERGDWKRQAMSLFLITWLFGLVIYYIGATLSYIFVFDKRTFNHPKFLKNQIRQEIMQTNKALPVMAIFTTPFFLAEVKGYSNLYTHTTDVPNWYNYFQFPLFIAFTDCFIYMIHRGLHHPLIYKHLHKPHHKWIMPTPYASHAFHPLDGYAQSLPYHIFPFIFPLHKLAYIALFAFINVWTIFIHDGEYIANSPIINGAACHTMHHLYFNYNYGQFTTIWDRLGGSYREPSLELFDKEKKMDTKVWNKQVGEMEKVVKEVEGDDSFREYVSHESKKSQ
ncbi:hypothetical protein BDZ91DRAFT_485300 [Kalaharituber pfeilii]|nr:hypothetical protein BDZ91DRAFT_485300 [Kalaharituber pfeilii]